jgi:hypothetical protein cdivTM_07069
MASIQLTPEKGLQLEKAEQHIVESTRVLNDISQSVRHEEINIYDQIAKYSGGTASVMFTFLGVLISLKSNQKYVNHMFIIAMALFVVCIGLSLLLRRAIYFWVFYQANHHRLYDLKKKYVLEKSILKDMEKKKDKIDGEITKNEEKENKWHFVYKYGSWLLYVCFTVAYIFLFAFVLSVFNKNV